MILAILFNPMQFIELYHIYFEMLSLLLTSTLAVLTVVFLIKQHKLQETNLRLAAYDRRLKIYNEIKIFLLGLSTGHNISRDKVILLQRNTQEAPFLFYDEELPRIINSYIVKGFELYHITEEIKDPIVINADINTPLEEREWRRQLAEKEKNEFRTKQEELFKWFYQQHEVIDKLFGKYLQIEQR